jgi:stage II sporulation protein D
MRRFRESVGIRAFRVVILTLSIAAALALPAAVSGKTWVVSGAGYGHGVGMSAYGAYGYGKHGAGYRQIIDHYFKGLKIKKMHGDPRVRVLLAIRSGDVTFTKATKACGRNLRPSRTYRAQRKSSKVRLLSSSGARLKNCGKRLHAKSIGKVKIKGVGTYRGALEVVPTQSASGSLNVINKLPVDDYVQGSLPGELFPSWPKETLKAFAVAIRSIALSTDVGGNGFELYADTRTQVYGGLKLETGRTNRAVRATEDQVAKYRGEVAQTTYFSASGGRTESRFLGGPHVPYLESVKDPYDYYSPQHRWTFHFSQSEMDSRLGPYVDGKLRKVKVTKRGDSPRIDEAKLVGTAGTTKVRGDTIQFALGLYDRWAYFKTR